MSKRGSAASAVTAVLVGALSLSLVGDNRTGTRSEALFWPKKKTAAGDDKQVLLSWGRPFNDAERGQEEHGPFASATGNGLGQQAEVRTRLRACVCVPRREPAEVPADRRFGTARPRRAPGDRNLGSGRRCRRPSPSAAFVKVTERRQPLCPPRHEDRCMLLRGGELRCLAALHQDVGNRSLSPQARSPWLGSPRRLRREARAHTQTDTHRSWVSSLGVWW